MSQVPRGKHDWLKNHYEKIILLIALLILLFSCMQLIIRVQNNKETIQRNMLRLAWTGDVMPLKDTEAFDGRLVQAKTEATATLHVAERTSVSERRVSCVKCGRPIPYAALECPFCLSAQPVIVDTEQIDTDGDGIPDVVELSWGLDPQNSGDAEGDMDGDGFSNLEEYLNNTDPKDPASHPPVIVKLRVAAIRPMPFYLRFTSISTLGNDVQKFQLNMQSAERTYFLELGQMVLGYKVEAYNPAGKDGETLTLVRQSDGRRVNLVKGKPVTEQELAIAFIFLIDGSRFPPKKLGDVLEVGGEEYKVVDISRENVIIQGVKSGEKVTVPMLSARERDAFTGRSAPVSSAVSGAPASQGSAW